jgi:cbb3-type cytochrome oxidase subunit 3
MGRFFNHLDASWWSQGFLILFVVLFLGLIAYWYNPKRRKDCDAFASIPLRRDEE